jgi:hypothetical protein
MTQPGVPGLSSVRSSQLDSAVGEPDTDWVFLARYVLCIGDCIFLKLLVCDMICRITVSLDNTVGSPPWLRDDSYRGWRGMRSQPKITT